MTTDFDLDVVEDKLKRDPTASDEDDDVEESGDAFSMDDYNPEEEDEPDEADKDDEELDKTEDAPKAKEPKPDDTKPVQDGGQQLTPQQEEAIRAQVIKLVGEDAVLTIKGVDRPLKDLTPREITIGLQKGIRGDQIFNELSAERHKLEEDRALIERGAQFVQDYLEKINSGQLTSEKNATAEMLRITDEDTEETAALKQALAESTKKLQSIEGAYRSTATEARLRSVIDDVKSFTKDYPLASVDEAIAVKVARPDVNTEDLMRAGHAYYSSEAHGRAVLDSNPEFKRKYDDEVIANYLARKTNAKSIPGTKSSSSSSNKVTEQAKKPVRDFKSADSRASAYLRELERNQSD